MTKKKQQSSGDVFRDIGFSPEEAANLRIRADLMVRLTKLIDARKLTQSGAAELFWVSQPRVSDLIRGKVDLFSIDMLVNMLARA